MLTYTSGRRGLSVCLSTQGTEIGQEVQIAGKLPWPECLTSLSLGHKFKDEVS